MATDIKGNDHYLSSREDEEALYLHRDWTEEEEKKAKRK
jgi:hypothetical protein